MQNEDVHMLTRFHLRVMMTSCFMLEAGYRSFNTKGWDWGGRSQLHAHCSLRDRSRANFALSGVKHRGSLTFYCGF